MNERRIVLSSIYLILLSIIVVMLSMLMLSSTPWLLFENEFGKYNTALAIPNVQINNDTSPSISTATNYPPESTVGPDQTVNENTTVILVGGAFDRNTNDKLSYSWIQTAGSPITLNRSNTTSPTFISPDVSTDTTLKFSLTAKDNKGTIGDVPAIATVIVKPVNHLPIADAGPDQIVDAGNIISLDGSNSTDPDDDSLSYSWVQIEGPEVELSGANSFMATLTAPPNNITSDTDLYFRLAVIDTNNASNTDDVKVTIKYIPTPNKPPLANAGSDQTVNASSVVNLDATKSKDPDGNISSYSWVQTEGPPVTLSDGGVPSPTFTAPTVSSDSMLKFSVTMKDELGATSIPDTVSIAVKARYSISATTYSYSRPDQ